MQHINCMRKSRKVDTFDKAILSALQCDASLTAEALGAHINLSPSQAARRKQRLDGQGVITGYVAKLSPAAVGLTVQAFIQVMFREHSPSAAAGFAKAVHGMPQVVAVWTMTGEADYLLRVWCADLAALNWLIHQEILAHPAVARVQSQIVMDQLKPDAPLPVF